MENTSIHIGYDHESLNITVTKDGHDVRHRGLFEDPEEIAEAIKKSFAAVGVHNVTTELEY